MEARQKKRKLVGLSSTVIEGAVMTNQDQNQKQEIKVQKDGTWETHYCPYFVDHLIEPVLQERDSWGDPARKILYNERIAFASRRILLIYRMYGTC